MKPKTESTPATPTTDPAAVDLAATGLFVKGQVMGRTRRNFAKEGKDPRYNITLSILTQDGLHKLERWTDLPSPSDVPAIGELVNIKVALTYYTGRSGTGVRLQWGEAHGSETF
jgi:hypothetical protein